MSESMVRYNFTIEAREYVEDIVKKHLVFRNKELDNEQYKALGEYLNLMVDISTPKTMPKTLEDVDETRKEIANCVINLLTTITIAATDLILMGEEIKSLESENLNLKKRINELEQ